MNFVADRGNAAGERGQSNDQKQHLQSALRLQGGAAEALPEKGIKYNERGQRHVASFRGLFYNSNK